MRGGRGEGGGCDAAQMGSFLDLARAGADVPLVGGVTRQSEGNGSGAHRGSGLALERARSPEKGERGMGGSECQKSMRAVI